MSQELQKLIYECIGDGGKVAMYADRLSDFMKEAYNLGAKERQESIIDIFEKETSYRDDFRIEISTDIFKIIREIPFNS